jgi:hypothetical protein
MTKTAGLTFGLILVALCLVAVGVGSCLLVTAIEMPPHTDEARADELSRLYERNYTENRELLKPIRQKIVALRTLKWELYDAGLDICLFFATLLFGIFYFGLWDLRNVRAVRTPRSSRGLLVLATIALLALVPALVLQTDTEWLRDDLAPTIDTGRGLMLFLAPVFFLTLWIPMMVVGRFLILKRAWFPANLWCWDSNQHDRCLMLTFCFGLLALLLVILLVWSAINFAWAIPTLMVGIYVILSSRAGLLARVN